MSRKGVGVALAGLFLLVPAAPSAASRAAIPTRTLLVAVPNQGDVTVAEAVFQVRGPRVVKAMHPRLRVLNAAQLGKDVVVVASVKQEVKNRSRLDVTAAVIQRGARTLSAVSAGTGGSAEALLVLDEPDLRTAQPQRSLVPVASVVTTNVVGGNFVPRYPADCESAKASFLSGDHTGLPGPKSTLSFSCGLGLDQDWMPMSFASAIGANWCTGLIEPPAGSSTAYPAGFACNFAIDAFAVQDPAKTIGVMGLNLSSPLQGNCKAPFQQSYIGICSLTTPLAANRPGGFAMSLAGPLPVGSEFGLTALSGSTQRNFPMREIDVFAAATIVAELIREDRTEWLVEARNLLTQSHLAQACFLLQFQLSLETPHWRPEFVDRLREALRLLDCGER